MTRSSKENEIGKILQSFPTLQMDEEKRLDITRHIRQEKELITRMKRRKVYRTVIGGIVVSCAFLLIGYQMISSDITRSEPILQQVNTEPSDPSQKANASEATLPSGFILTEDPQIDAYVGEAIDKIFTAYFPENITMIVTDPHTGEILAMRTRGKKEHDDSLAEAVRAVPDPVVAFPIVTLAAAIEEGKYNSNEVYNSGKYEIAPGQSIKDHNAGIGWGKITYEEGVQRSSNVAFAKLGYERLPKDSLQDYLKRFRFGTETGTDIYGEENGELPKMDTPYDVGMAATGQAGSATAIQQVAAVGAIANGGEWLRPHLAKPNLAHKEKGRQIISEKTAEQVREILESNVSSAVGSSKAFAIKGHSVAGRSGIAEKRDQQGKVIEGKYTYSFIGFAPSDDPKLLVYITVDDPRTDSWVQLWGKEIVAPPFTEVMEKSLQYLQQR